MNATSRSRHRLTTTLLVTAGLLCLPLTASAQRAGAATAKQPKWTIEAFGGYAFSPAVPSGAASVQFPAGNQFPTEGGFTSRSNPSWYFGDGAVLFNEVAAQFASQFNIQVPRIVPLDTMLGKAGRQDQSGSSFGGRISRKLTSRLSLELGFQRSQAKTDLTGGASAALEESRASFEAGFRELLSTIPQAGLQVSSRVERLTGETMTSRMVVSGVLNVGVVRSGPLGIHVSGGVGRSSSSSGALSFRLRGDYGFRFFDVNPISETDNVTIRMTDDASAMVGVLGGGFTYDVGARHGLRADVRVYVGDSAQTTVVEAVPFVSRTGPALTLPSATNPSIQFSNTTLLPSSLSGTLTDFKTFTSGGREVRPHVTVGYFLRF